ncbi:MAG TPA: sulfatase [Planctomycetota bacterium]|nr:sulfatase [Planctomycetota bacterium]
MLSALSASGRAFRATGRPFPVLSAPGLPFRVLGAPSRLPTVVGAPGLPPTALGALSASGRELIAFSAPGRSSAAFSTPSSLSTVLSAPRRALAALRMPGRPLGALSASGRELVEFSAPGRASAAPSASGRPLATLGASARAHAAFSDLRPAHIAVRVRGPALVLRGALGRAFVAPGVLGRAFVALAAFGAAACAPAPPRATPARPNVLLIVVDTLRADRLGCHGGTRGLSPRIDALAAQGANFANAFSHAPWTLPAFASLLSSELPPSHGAGGKVDDFHGLRKEVPTLPDAFRSAGYATAAIVNVDFLARPFGVTRAFERLDARAFEDNENVRAAGPTTDAALAWVSEHKERAFFLMVHYFDPHAEYRPPQPFRERFAAPEDQHDESFRFGTRHQVVDHRVHRTQLSPADVDRARLLYDGEVAYVDQEVGRLLDGLGSLALDANTLVVLTADHGEEFLDHGDWEHGHSLYDELLEVPLLVRQPGRVAPRVVDAPVGHVDIGPTLLAWCGLPGNAAFRGRDLAPALAGAALAPTPLLAFGNFWGPPLASLRDQDFQLIVRPDGKRELYRWRSDPNEQHDLAAEEPAVAAALAAQLEKARADAADRGAGLGPRVALTAEQQRRLSAVGYAGDE